MQLVQKFDVDKAVHGLTNFGIRSSLEAQFDAVRPMGNVAMSLVNTVAKAAFVGLFSDVEQVLPRCVEWLRGAIASREALGSTTDYHLSLLNQALALARWMREGHIKGEVWECALRDDRVAVSINSSLYSARDLISTRLDHIMSMAVLAGNYEAAVSEYEQVLGAGLAKGRQVFPRHYAYAVARSRLGFSDDFDMKIMGNAMISASVEPLLIHGNYIEAATLVCLVRSKVEGSTDAVAALRSALD